MFIFIIGILLAFGSSVYLVFSFFKQNQNAKKAAVAIVLGFFLMVVGVIIDDTPPEEKNSTVVNEDEKVDENIFKSNITTLFATNIDQPEYTISDEDYIKYNEIMEYLGKYIDTPEEKLFKELESEYNQTSNELRDFMNANMQNAIDRDFGKTTNTVKLDNSDIQDVIKEFFKVNVEDSVLFKIDSSQADIEITNLRSVCKGEFEYNNRKYSYLIKTEHSSNFETVEVFQLKIDESNIDLN